MVIRSQAIGILRVLKPQLDNAAGHARQAHMDVLEAVGKPRPGRHILEVVCVTRSREMFGIVEQLSRRKLGGKCLRQHGASRPAWRQVCDSQVKSIISLDFETGIIFRRIGDIKVQGDILCAGGNPD